MVMRQLKAWFIGGLILHRVNGKYFFWYHTAKRYKELLLNTDCDINWTSLCIWPRFVGVSLRIYNDKQVMHNFRDSQEDSCDQNISVVNFQAEV